MDHGLKGNMTNLLRLFALFAIILGVSGCGGGSNNGAEKKASGQVATQDTQPAYGDMYIQGSIGDASVLLPVWPRMPQVLA